MGAEPAADLLVFHHRIIAVRLVWTCDRLVEGARNRANLEPTLEALTPSGTLALTSNNLRWIGVRPYAAATSIGPARRVVSSFAPDG